MPSNEHKCHAIGCTTLVPPRMLLCYKHWLMVSRPLQNKVWKTYRKGQEITKNPSPEYMEASRAAIEYVYAAEQGAEDG